MRVTQLSLKAAAAVIFPGGAPDDDTLAEAVAGRHVLVTGASYGIGHATATRLARAGARVSVVARSAEPLEDLAREQPGIEPHAADLTDYDAIPALAAELTADGPIDVVVSNAGRSIRRSVRRSYDRFHDYERTMAINYLAPVRLLLELLPAMRERGSGHIVNVSTMGVLLPPAPRWGAYGSSKAAFDHWMRSTAAEIRPDGVTATSVYMGLVRTRMSAPTYEGTPAPSLNVDQAAGLLCKAIVERPAAIGPWWANAAAGFDSIARGPSELLTRHLGGRFG